LSTLLRIRERDPETRRWKTVFDPANPPAELILNEVSDVEVVVADADAVRLVVGGWMCASSRTIDRADFAFAAREAADGADIWVARGRLLRDWVGVTDLQILTLARGEWHVAADVRPIRVIAGKIAQAEFEAMCDDVAASSAAALLDVVGKTFFGLELEHRPGDTAPVAAAVRIRHAVDHLSTALREIASQPAYRLRTRRVREPALAELGVNDLTLEEACLDPSVVIRHGSRIAFREQVREVADAHYNLPENRVLSGFLNFLGIQIGDLTARLRTEIAIRQERRLERHRPSGDGSKSWWESEDAPRIAEMHRLLETFHALQIEVARLQRYPFLPAGEQLREVPTSTPLVRSHRAYAAAFRVILSHFRAFRVRIDGGHLLTRGKSLPALYEWWCVLDVLRVLRSALTICAIQPSGRGSPVRSLDGGRAGFAIDFVPDQVVDFEDEAGRVVRWRYVPSYRPETESGGSAYGLLSPESERTPDLALEIFAPTERASAIPELIVVFDAKYTMRPHSEKLEEVRLKYGKIGIFETGHVLSRQVWAMLPSAPARTFERGPPWAASCTVDNTGFWSESYDMASATAGAIQARPRIGEGRPPLDGLIRLILKRAGVAVRL
jgi:Domain of unknown function (DUF2357)/PD-(D/E)XK nuclease superfamily